MTMPLFVLSIVFALIAFFGWMFWLHAQLLRLQLEILSILGERDGIWLRGRYIPVKNKSQLYIALAKLEEAGFIESKSGGVEHVEHGIEMRVYRLRRKGIA